jgi:cyclophilin family peptidyl-prolyl cis-trans isomerase
VKLFREETPRTVENFTVHSRHGYYDNAIFHRVIKGFMVQTGKAHGLQPALDVVVPGCEAWRLWS